MTCRIAQNARASVYFLTLGCAKNEVDSANMQERLAVAGFAIVDDPMRAQAIVVNTCSFIQSATEESIEVILDAASLDNVRDGSCKLIVAGCMPARYGEDLENELTEVHSFVPCSKEDDIADVVERALGLASDDAAVDQSSTLRRTGVSAYVKISDGCDRFCSYCTIPFIRGGYRSFTYEAILQEVRKQIDLGVREIVLIAQDTGRWGEDFDSEDTLASLMGRLAERFPSTWFRVMYLEPEGVTDELLETMRAHGNICNYLDIPLQHVDATLLEAMNRRGSRCEFEELIARIRTRIPDITLRTTLIAGFPGETEDQFEELCDFVEQGYFDYVGAFAFSREEGTRAYDLDDQLEEDEKLERMQRIRDIADSVCSQLVATRIGKTMDVLIEGVEEDGQLYGRAMCQAPDVDGVVYVEDGTIGEIASITISDTLLYEMEGE